MRRLHPLAADAHLASVDRLRRERAGLVEARRPQPLVDAQRVCRRGRLSGLAVIGIGVGVAPHPRRRRGRRRRSASPSSAAITRRGPSRAAVLRQLELRVEALDADAERDDRADHRVARAGRASRTAHGAVARALRIVGRAHRGCARASTASSTSFERAVRVHGRVIPRRHRLRGLGVPRRRHVGVRPWKIAIDSPLRGVLPMRVGARDVADQRAVRLALDTLAAAARARRTARRPAGVISVANGWSCMSACRGRHGRSGRRTHRCR